MKVIIMSGPPGSGKSYLARHYARGLDTGVIVSADHYFHGLKDDYRGIEFKDVDTFNHQPYIFAPEEIGNAHANCGEAFVKAIEACYDLIIVDNTNITIGEKAPYIAAASWLHVDKVEIHRLETPLGICRERNTHQVPVNHLDAMYHNHHARNDAGYLREELPWWDVKSVNG